MTEAKEERESAEEPAAALSPLEQEMLAALKAVVSVRDKAAFAQARAAILKATGGQS